MAIALRLPDTPDLRRTYTAEELFAFPTHWHYELIRGTLRSLEMPAGAVHGRLTAKLAARVTVFVEDNALGECFTAETGFLAARDPDTVLAPDFAFVRAAKLPDPLPGGFVRVVPDLVLETRSPNDRPREVSDKVQDWLAIGVGLVLELNPNRQVLTVFRPGTDPLVLTVADTFDGGGLLPGFTLPLARLFA